MKQHLYFKKLIFLLIFLFTFFIPACTDTRCFIFGTELQRNVKYNNYAKMLGGAAASIAFHTLGHHLVAEIFQVDIYQDGLNECTIEGTHSRADLRWVSRGGFLLQSLVGIGLTSFEYSRDSYFTKGFVGMTALELGAYPLIWKDEGDFQSITNRGGDGSDEYNLYALIGAYNLYRIYPIGGPHETRRYHNHL